MPDVCVVAKKCGGCRYTGIPYTEQLEMKQKNEEELLGRFGKVEKIIGMRYPCFYRNKVTAAFGKDKKGNIICGTYQEGTHYIVQVDKCLIEDRKCQEIIRTIKNLLKAFKMEPFNEDTGKGLLRHVLVRRGIKTDEIMVVLVLGTHIFPSGNNFVKELLKLHPEITTVVVNINERRTSMVLGEREKVSYGKGYITDELCGCRFRISPSSFYQINPIQTEVLYGKAIEFAGLTGNERVIDAYCGIGTIGMVAAKHAKNVIGVELNGNAVRDARMNAKENKIENIEFFKGDAGDFMVKMASEGAKADVVFMDPPRAGSTEEFLAAVKTLAPKKLVYVSCNPVTLSRDLEFITRNGYKVKKIQPVDMFPFTEHCETVVLLSKGGVDSKKIRVEFSLEDMDMSESQDGATYPQIKEYVLEHTGLKISSLYISQVKRKCGLEVGKNYNLPKSVDSKQPQCPPKKEKAIREALKYFQMI